MKRKQTLDLITKLAFGIVCLLFLTSAAEAQKKRRATPVRRTPAAAARPAVTPFAVREASQKVSIQIKNVSKFVYLLGGIAKDIEMLDQDIRDRKILRQQIIDKNQRDKEAVVTSIANLQAGLTALESEFQTNLAIRQYSFPLSGISQLAAQSRSEAAAGQLTQSGKTLLLVIEKLSDTLVAMP